MSSRQARYQARIRKARVKAGLCRDCGGKVEIGYNAGKPGQPGSGYRCEACNIKRNK